MVCITWPAWQVVLAELDQHGERNVGHQPDQEHERQSAVFVRAGQQRDQGGEHRDVADLHGADHSGAVGDPAA